MCNLLNLQREVLKIAKLFCFRYCVCVSSFNGHVREINNNFLFVCWNVVLDPEVFFENIYVSLIYTHRMRTNPVVLSMEFCLFVIHTHL